jgi:hypothetical protein
LTNLRHPTFPWNYHFLHRAMLGKTHVTMGLSLLEPVVNDQAFCPTYITHPVGRQPYSASGISRFNALTPTVSAFR